MTDPPRARCPRCKGPGERLISGGTGLLFKGGGFYATDYRSDSYKRAAKAESGEASAKPETKTEKTEKAEKAEKPEKPAAPAKGAKGEARSGKRGHRAN
jgi:predicted nucleic acid-binding Zn ribbon protein